MGNRLIGRLPKVGIRPVIDGRERGVRESLEEQCMAMAKNAAKLIEDNLRFASGEGISCIIADTTIGGVAEAARRNGRIIVIETDADLTLPLRPNAIKRCLTNLVENAVRYGNHVDITARRNGESVEVVIEDDGPGIPRESQEEVFKPFFRLDDSRNPNYAGAGLGLAIARDIARGHGGDILLDKSSTGGLRATLWLPI